MKFVISSQELNYLINKIQNIVPQKPSSPILNNFLIEACNDELIFTATDLTVSLRCHIDARVIEEGSATLPAKRLAQLVRELPAVDVEMTANPAHLITLMAGSSRFKLNGLSAAEYPQMPDLSLSHSFVISQPALKDLFFRTSFAVSREDNRYVLTGVHLEIAHKFLTMTGTDGKRLARARIPIEIAEDFTYQAVLPLKAVEEIQKNLLDEGEATVTLMPDKIAVDGNQLRVVSKLIDGEFPNLSRVLPSQSQIHITLQREELIALLRQVLTFVSVQYPAVRFTFTQGELRVSATSAEVGEGDVSMPVNYHGPTLEVAFSPNFFIDMLRHSKEETVTLGMTDGYNPGILTEGEAVPSLAEASPLFFIMPMRLTEV